MHNRTNLREVYFFFNLPRFFFYEYRCDYMYFKLFDGPSPSPTSHFTPLYIPTGGGNIRNKITRKRKNPWRYSNCLASDSLSLPLWHTPHPADLGKNVGKMSARTLFNFENCPYPLPLWIHLEGREGVCFGAGLCRMPAAARPLA